MTLRATLEIVPHGNEDKKYTIGTLEMHNQGGVGFGHCQYLGQQFSDAGTLIKETVDGSLLHRRDLGAWELVRKTIEVLKIGE